jgi:hypothetical protein
MMAQAMMLVRMLSTLPDRASSDQSRSKLVFQFQGSGISGQ